MTTRVIGSRLLCAFFGFHTADANLESLNQSTEKSFYNLKNAKKYSIQQKWCEVIFEFICLEKLIVNDEEKLVIYFAKLNLEVSICFFKK